MCYIIYINISYITHFNNNLIKNYLTITSSKTEVQCGHLEALIFISDKQKGHSFVVGSGSTGSFLPNLPRLTFFNPLFKFLFKLLATVIAMKIENAIIKKSKTDDKKAPYFIVIS